MACGCVSAAAVSAAAGTTAAAAVGVAAADGGDEGVYLRAAAPAADPGTQLQLALAKKLWFR